MIPKNIEKEHIEKAIAEIDSEGIRPGRHSTTYDLVQNGKSYPPKLVISIANKYANGSELDPKDFEGGKETEAFQLLEKHGFNIKEKNSGLNQDEIVNGIKLLCETSIEVEGYYKSDQNIVQALNKAEKSDLVQCVDYYSSRTGVVIDIRKELIERLIKNEKFTVESLHELIQKYKIGKEEQFRSYKETFSIVFPAITFYGHNKQRNFVDSFTRQIIKDLSIDEFVKHISFDFQGVRQQGTDRYWVAIYNKMQKNQSSSLQFFIEFYKGKIGYGVYRHSDKTYLKPREEATPNEFSYPKMISYFAESRQMLIDDIPDKIVEMTNPLNTILYGPPGTGKTYNTILRAAEIVENRKIDKYEEALRIFNDNLHNRIEFITFHQNYSYEDFIQGLRPETDNKSSLTFEKKDGVFKRIADRAKRNSYYIPVGTELKDYKVIKSNDDIIELWSERTKSIRYVPPRLIIDLYDGIKSNKITLEDIKKRREIDLPELIDSKVEKYYFGIEGTLYNICEYLLENEKSNNALNYVIIIDEINRANISRVFGELITLIEPDKRSEGSIPMHVKLPSGDSFNVPSNLYIIGTMNTADKSIALLDIALRRRFEFESMYPLYEIDDTEIYDKDILFKINEQIIKLKGHDFQIGHAYFMGENKDLIQRMNKKVIPLLLEYFMNDAKEVNGILFNAGLQVEENAWPMKITGRRA